MQITGCTQLEVVGGRGRGWQGGQELIHWISEGIGCSQTKMLRTH